MLTVQKRTDKGNGRKAEQKQIRRSSERPRNVTDKRESGHDGKYGEPHKVRRGQAEEPDLLSKPTANRLEGQEKAGRSGAGQTEGADETCDG